MRTVRFWNLKILTTWQIGFVLMNDVRIFNVFWEPPIPATVPLQLKSIKRLKRERERETLKCCEMNEKKWMDIRASFWVKIVVCPHVITTQHACTMAHTHQTTWWISNPLETLDGTPTHSTFDWKPEMKSCCWTLKWSTYRSKLCSNDKFFTRTANIKTNQHHHHEPILYFALHNW